MTGTELFEAFVANHQHADYLIDLYYRYQNEKEHEDINDYLAPIKAIFPTAFKMSKYPFGITCQCDDEKFKIMVIKRGEDNFTFRGEYIYS